MGYKDDNYSSRVCNHHPETCTCRDWDINENPKQETLKEKMWRASFENESILWHDGFISGAKWMEKEMEKLKDFDTWKEWKNK
jgi:hypothetical protein